ILDSGAPALAAAPTLQALFAQYQQVAADVGPRVGCPFGPVYRVGADLALTAYLAARGGDPTELRNRLTQLRVDVIQTGLPFDQTPLDAAIQALNSGAPASAAAPILQVALSQYQQVADEASG